MPPQEQHHRLYLSFQSSNGWHCQFLEPDLKTSVPRQLHFKSSDKLIELVERAGGFPDLESRLAMNHGLEIGRGGVFLSLTEGAAQESESTLNSIARRPKPSCNRRSENQVATLS